MLCAGEGSGKTKHNVHCDWDEMRVGVLSSLGRAVREGGTAPTAAVATRRAPPAGWVVGQSGYRAYGRAASRRQVPSTSARSMR